MSFVTAPHHELANGLAVALVLAGLVAAPAHGAACSAEADRRPCRWSSSTRRKGAAAVRRPIAGYPPHSPRTRREPPGLRSHSTSIIGIVSAGRIALPHLPSPKGNTTGCARTARASSIRRRFVVQGRDFPQWQERRGAAALAAAAAKPARAEIMLAAERERGSIAVKATARVPSLADRKGAVLYVALADDGLSSEVKAGENAGARLAHDNVVRLFRAGPSPDAKRRDALGDHAAGARGSRKRIDGRRVRSERRCRRRPAGVGAAADNRLRADALGGRHATNAASRAGFK